jgi:hypothetical protein
MPAANDQLDGRQDVGVAVFAMRVWSVAAIAVLLVVGGWNGIGMARRVPPPARAEAGAASSVVMRHEQRFAGVREALQRRGARGTICYLADVAGAELAAHPRGMEEYFLTQFVLVPWVLDATRHDGEFVVANLHASAIGARMPPGFRVAEDFGNGVCLLERVRP